MTVDRGDFHMAAELCNIEFDRLYHLLMSIGLTEHAPMVRALDKGQLIARLVTRGIDSGDFSDGEMFVMLLVALMQARHSMSPREVVAVLNEARGLNAAREVMRRMREGARP